MYELVRVGHDKLVGEIIRLEGDKATIQVFFLNFATGHSHTVWVIPYLVLRRDQWCISWWSRRANWFATFCRTWSWYFGINFWWYSGMQLLKLDIWLSTSLWPHTPMVKMWPMMNGQIFDFLATSERYRRYDPVNLYPPRYYDQCLEPRDKMGLPTSTSHQSRLQSHWWWCLWNRHWKYSYRTSSHGSTKSEFSRKSTRVANPAKKISGSGFFSDSTINPLNPENQWKNCLPLKMKNHF